MDLGRSPFSIASRRMDETSDCQRVKPELRWPCSNGLTAEDFETEVADEAAWDWEDWPAILIKSSKQRRSRLRECLTCIAEDLADV